MGWLFLEFVLLAASYATWRHYVNRSRVRDARVEATLALALGVGIVLHLCRLGGGL